MKTKFLLIATILFMAKPLFAVDIQPERTTVEHCYSVLISSIVGSPTNVVASTTAANSYQIGGSYNGNIRDILIQNDDSTNNIYCSDNVQVSTFTLATSTNVFNQYLGFGIAGGALGAAGTIQDFVILPGQKFYCINGSQSKNTVATVCAGR